MGFIIALEAVQIEIILGLIGLDVILGIAAAIIKKKFELSKLASFMKGPVLGYVLGLVVIVWLIDALELPSFISWPVFGLIALALLGSIFKNLRKMGARLPKFLQ